MQASPGAGAPPADERAVCPACAHADFRLYREVVSGVREVPDGLDRGAFVHVRIERCASCGLYRTVHLGDPRTPAQLYEEDSVSFEASASKIGAAGDRSPSSTDELSMLGVEPPARLLDVGCGAGAFLSRAARAGYEASGIDLDPKAVAFARDRLGLSVQRMSLEELPQSERYDVITMLGVLEHIPEPARFLSWAREHLADGGEVLIGVPHAGSLNRLVSRLSRDEWDMFLEPGHLYHYDVRTLGMLAARAGLTPRRWATGTMTIRGKLPFLPFRSAPLERRLRGLVASYEVVRRAYGGALRLLDAVRAGDMLFATFVPEGREAQPAQSQDAA